MEINWWEACELCNTVGPGAESWWSSPDPNSRPYCLLHCSTLQPGQPHWAKWDLISSAQQQWCCRHYPHWRWGQALSRAASHKWYQSGSIHSNDPGAFLSAPLLSVKGRLCIKEASQCHSEANQEPPWSMMSCQASSGHHAKVITFFARLTFATFLDIIIQWGLFIIRIRSSKLGQTLHKDL